MRWIVDAMNVIGSRPDGWWKDRRGAVAALVGRLDGWAGAGGHQVTVVLEHPPHPPLTAQTVRIAAAERAAANSADDAIVALVAADPDPAGITVVTSDAALIRRVGDLGAATAPAGAFRRRLDDEAPR